MYAVRREVRFAVPVTYDDRNRQAGGVKIFVFNILCRKCGIRVTIITDEVVIVIDIP